MLARYLGSKQSILEPLLSEIATFCRPGDHLVDAFSGSLSVALAGKLAGYRVSANDVNLFSAVLGAAYLAPDGPPIMNPSLISARHRLDCLAAGREQLHSLTAESPIWANAVTSHGIERLVGILAFNHYLTVLDEEDLPGWARKSHFFDAYCEEGRASAFTSSRGSTGRRRFFTPQNARRLDLALNQIRVWHAEAALGGPAEAMLLATVMRGAEKVANTQGTFHDFPRNRWDSRAFGSFKMTPPPIQFLSPSAGEHTYGVERDTLEWLPTVGRHKLLYLDPPYNFRQYSAYYFLPNLICRYPDIPDTDEYFSKLAYVRGQNPEDDFTSTFCSSKYFVRDMTKLVATAQADAVLISYFTGKNHWSKFDSERDDTGLRMLTDVLSSSLFVEGSQKIVEVPRKNYASYGGFQARDVKELLLSARLKKGVANDTPESADGRLHSMA